MALCHRIFYSLFDDDVRKVFDMADVIRWWHLQCVVVCWRCWCHPAGGASGRLPETADQQNYEQKRYLLHSALAHFVLLTCSLTYSVVHSLAHSVANLLTHKLLICAFNRIHGLE